MTQTTPQVLITRQQYLADIKVRWEIHQYETNEYVKDSYQREFGPKTTV
jgi:hypothetical protein